MGRKRGFGNGDSSGEDDDFQPSDGDSSPVFSRLKRKRQSSGRDRSATSSASGHGSGSLAEGNKQEEENEVICIPDSLDEDDEKEVEETPVSKDPKIPWRSAKETDSADDDEPAAEDDPVESEDEDAAKPEDENRSEHSDENEARGKTTSNCVHSSRRALVCHLSDCDLMLLMWIVHFLLFNTWGSTRKEATANVDGQPNQIGRLRLRVRT